MKFEELNLVTPILKAVDTEGYVTPTPIQQKAIPVILDGNDVLGCAQTGTGKTAAFAIPMLQILHEGQKHIGQKTEKGPRAIKALVLTPTRELAIQIGESFAAYGKYTGIRHTVIYGGVSQNPQTSALKAGVDILVATPGRLLDLMNQGYIDLSHVKMFVLDEADRMLDMGFSHDVKKVVSHLPSRRQTLLFCATMEQGVMKMVNAILTNPVRVEVAPVSSTVDAIEQKVYFVDRNDKKSLLIQLLKKESVDSALVFTRTKHRADKVARDLAKAKIAVQVIHGDKSQQARQIALNNFKLKRTRVLVATDIASRGIDVQELSHVINFDMPDVPETYVHRIGRTGRAGMCGTAVSFCDNEEKGCLRDIQKLISMKIPVIENQVL